MNKQYVYVLTLNGEVDGSHGDYVYLVGAFESELLAKEAMNNIINKYPNSRLSTKDFELNRVSMNQALDVDERGEFYKYYQTDIFLGGYI